MILQVRCRLLKLADIFYFLNYDMYSLIKKSPENKACKIKRARDGTRTLRHLVNPYKIKEKNTLSSRCLQFLYDIYI